LIINRKNMLPCFTVTINETTTLPPLALTVRGGRLTSGAMVELAQLTPPSVVTYWVAAEDRWTAFIEVVSATCHDDLALDDLEHGFRVKDVSEEQSEDPFFMTLQTLRRNQGDTTGILHCSDWE
jgi:hypothetical protein